MKLLTSPVIAAFILSAGLITSALIIKSGMPEASKPRWSDETIKTEFVKQMTKQFDSQPDDCMGTPCQVKGVEIDEYHASPERSRVLIKYHFTYDKTDVRNYTEMTLYSDPFGRLASGDVSGPIGNKKYSVTIS